MNKKYTIEVTADEIDLIGYSLTCVNIYKMAENTKKGREVRELLNKVSLFIESDKELDNYIRENNPVPERKCPGGSQCKCNEETLNREEK